MAVLTGRACCIGSIPVVPHIFRYPESIKGDQHLKEWRLINLRLLDAYREEIDKAGYRWNRLIEG